MDFFKKNFCKLTIVLEFLLSILLAANILDYLYEKVFNNISKGMDIFFIIVSAALIIAIIIYNIIKNKKKIEIYFLIFMIPLGMMYQVFIMPNYVPDELEHIVKAYDMSNGNIVTKIDENGDSKINVPKILSTDFDAPNDKYTDIENAANSKTNYNDTTSIYSAAQSYSPVLYMFSALGLFISKIFNINIVFAIYLARLFNYIFFLVCGYFAIKLIPFGKLVVFTYLFNSMLIHQAVSVSADSVTNSIIILFIAYTLYIWKEKNKLSIKNKILYFLLAISLAISKNVYFPIVFISLILLSKNTLNEKKDKAFIIATVAISVISAVLWYLFGRMYKDVYVDIMNMGYNPQEQIKFILSSPLNFIVILIRTMLNTTIYYAYSFLGSNLGWLNIIPSTNIHLIIYALLLILSPFLEENTETLKWPAKIWLLLVTIGVTALMLIGFYINATPVGDVEVQAMQGRYFIPIAILPLLCMVFKNKSIKIKNIELIYALILCITNGIQIYTILSFLL